MVMFRSTKGASKHRRDLINAEISTLRDLLPLPESARQRLSQLQIMSLGCVYIRKCNYFARLFGQTGFSQEAAFEFSQSMTGFLLITTREGKLLYISENVTEFLGHSMVDMMTQGDSLYDIIDKRDHAQVQAQLLQTSYPGVHAAAAPEVSEERTFFCRMNVARSFRRQAGFGDHKVMHIRGHFISPMIRDHYGNQPVFMAFCTPLITPDVKETVVQNNTMMFQSVHGLDMKYTELGPNGQFHLGYTEEELKDKSWYELIHPEDILDAKDKHTQLIKSSHEMGCMLTVRLQNKSGEWVWVNMVMHIRQPFICDNGDPAIVCINHIIREVEAHHFKVQSQLYSSHIARSPEFLPSPQRASPPHTITQVPVEHEQYPIPGYPVQPQQQGDGTGMGFYQDQFGAAVTTASSSENGNSSLEHVLALNPDVGTYSSEYSNSMPTQKQKLRAGLLDKLKRRKIKAAEQETCMPPVKMSRLSNEAGTPEGPPGGVSLTVRGSILSGAGIELPTGFAVAGIGGPQMLVHQAQSPMYEQLVLRKPVVMEQIPQVMPSVREMAPLTPPTPDSPPDCSTAAGIPTTTTELPGLNVEMGDMALVPHYMLTPDSSPAASPTDTAATTFEQQPQCVPSLLSELADIQVLTDVDMENEPSLISQTKALKVQEVKAKRLPELDIYTLENFFSKINGGQSKQEAQIHQEATHQPSVHVVEKLPEQALIPQTVLEMSGDEYSDASSPATSTTSLEETADSSNDLLNTRVFNETQLDSLVATVTDAILGLAQASRTTTAGSVDISGGFVMVPDHATALADSPAQTCPDVAKSSQGDTDGTEDSCQILSPEVTGELIDELHQLNELAGSTPSYGDDDLTSSLFDHNL